MRLNVDLSGADTTTADRINSGLQIDIDSSANGDASDEHRIYGVNSTINFTGYSDIVRGGYFLAESNYTGAKTAQLAGVYGYAIHDAGSTNGGVSNMYGVYGLSAIQDLGDVDNAFGGYFNVSILTNRGAADVGVTKAVEGEISIDKDVAINYGTMIGVSSIIDNNEGSTPNFSSQYLFKGDYQGDKGGNAYGIYVEGDKHYFDGNVGIGVTTPDAKLHAVSADLGGTNNDTTTQAIFQAENSNTSKLYIQDYRTLDGTDWTSSGKRIQEKIDSTWMGYIQFNGGETASSGNGDISFGTGQSTTQSSVAERMRIDSSGQVIINNGDVTIGQDGTYGSDYGMIAFSGTTNGEPRIFGGLTNKTLYLTSGTGGNLNFRTNGTSANKMVIDNDGATTITTDGTVSATTLTLSQTGGIAIDEALGYLNFYSNDPSASSTGGVGGIAVRAETTFNTSYTPSYMSFYTHDTSTNDGTTEGNVTERMRITSTGHLQVSTGYFELTSQPTTKLWLSTNQVQLYAGNLLVFGGYNALNDSVVIGNESGDVNVTLAGGANDKVLYLEGSSGNVGIGTQTPLAKLDIQGTQGQLFSVTDDLSGSIFAVSDISGVPIFDVNSSGVSYFDGNVGIGTSSPKAKLEVAASVNGNPVTSGSTQTNGALRVRGSATNVLDIGQQSASPYAMWMQVCESTSLGVSYPLVINPNGGNVGIGTTVPGSTLTLGNDTGNVAELRVLRSNSLSTTYGFINTVGGTAQLGGSGDTRIIASTGRLLFNSNSTDQISLEANGEYRLKLGSTTTGYEASMANDNTAYQIFGSRFGGTGKYVAIWSDGANENTRFYPTKTVFYKNVGIGTDSPSGKFHVKDGSVNALFVTSTTCGNVGIKTTSPNASLVVKGNVSYGYNNYSSVANTWTNALSFSGYPAGLYQVNICKQSNASAYIIAQVKWSGTAGTVINTVTSVQYGITFSGTQLQSIINTTTASSISVQCLVTYELACV
jgi:hypothetical protein